MTKQVVSCSIVDRFRDFFKERAKRRLDEPNDMYGDTLLHRACYKDDPERIRLLLDRGADPNVSNLVGTTPLHWVCRYPKTSHTDLVRFLLERGADVNVRDKNGRTPLHIACSYGYPQVVHLLIQQGADVTTRDREGTPHWMM